MESKETTPEAAATQQKESHERRVLIDRQTEAIRQLHQARAELYNVRQLILNSDFCNILILDW
jgi:hypothetical protein